MCFGFKTIVLKAFYPLGDTLGLKWGLTWAGIGLALPSGRGKMRGRPTHMKTRLSNVYPFSENTNGFCSERCGRLVHTLVTAHHTTSNNVQLVEIVVETVAVLVNSEHTSS